MKIARSNRRGRLCGLVALLAATSVCGGEARPAAARTGQTPVAAASTAMPAVTRGLGARNLYHPGRQTYFAYLNYATWARRAPDARAPRVAHLGLQTEDGTDELVLILAEATDHSGATWVRAELPVRPVGATGWIPVSALGEVRQTSTLVRVDTRRLMLTVITGGRVVMTAPVGIGRARYPTPRGSFYVRDRLVSTDPNGLYGPLAFGLSAKSRVLTEWPHGGVVGIHGTSQPGLIPGRPSHGCIRMRNAAVTRLDRLVSVGDPVIIS
jgi:hypothetical protein